MSNPLSNNALITVTNFDRPYWEKFFKEINCKIFIILNEKITDGINFEQNAAANKCDGAIFEYNKVKVILLKQITASGRNKVRANSVIDKYLHDYHNIFFACHSNHETVDVDKLNYSQKKYYSCVFTHDVDPDWSLIKKVFDVIKNGNNPIESLENLFNFIKKKSFEFLKVCLLQVLLPIDIDMQALADERTTDKRKYLKEMLGDVESGFFLNKFNETEELINRMPEGDKKNELKNFLCIDEGKSSYIYKFLELVENRKLEYQKKECTNLTQKEDVISYFSNKDYKTFHDWYWKLTNKGTQ